MSYRGTCFCNPPSKNDTQSIQPVVYSTVSFKVLRGQPDLCATEDKLLDIKSGLQEDGYMWKIFHLNCSSKVKPQPGAMCCHAGDQLCKNFVHLYSQLTPQSYLVFHNIPYNTVIPGANLTLL